MIITLKGATYAGVTNEYRPKLRQWYGYKSWLIGG